MIEEWRKHLNKSDPIDKKIILLVEEGELIIGNVTIFAPGERRGNSNNEIPKSENRKMKFPIRRKFWEK